MHRHALQRRLAQQALRAQVQPWHVRRMFFSTSTKHWSEETDYPTSDELIAYNANKEFNEAKADEALLFMHQYGRAFTRLQDELERDLASIPLKEMEEAGMDMERITKVHDQVTRSLKTLRQATRNSQDHILDVLHQPYPTLDPYPFKEYQQEWSSRKKTEQAQELNRLKGVIAADKASIEMMYETLYSSLVDQYGQAFVDEGIREGESSTYLDVEAEEVDEQHEPLLGEEIDAVKTIKAPFGLFTSKKVEATTESSDSTKRKWKIESQPEGGKQLKSNKKPEPKAMTLMEQLKFLTGRS